MSDTAKNDEKLITSQLLNFQQDGLDYLYSLEPTQNNLFWMGNFCEFGSPEKRINSFPSAQFRVQSANFQLPSLEFDEHKQLKAQFLKSISYAKEVQISWIDDYQHSVLRYHLDWLSCWYNRRFDCVVSGPRGKLRQCDLYLFHYIEAKNDGALIEDTLAQPELLAKIHIGGMVPKQLGEFKVEMGSPDAGNTRSISYVVNNIQIDYVNSSLNGLPLINENNDYIHNKYKDTFDQGENIYLV